jgi:hypothetical protein
MTPVAAGRAPVITHTEGAAVVLEPSPNLDSAVGTALLDTVAAVVATGPERVEIDLCSVTAWTPDGAQALVACRDLCHGVPDGLHYRACEGPGRDALLAAYS